MTDHDLIVVGGGAAGLAAIRTALWAKADVALITDSPPGGDCTFTGCVPSKTLLAAARDGLDFKEAIARVRATVEQIAATESVEVLRSHGVTVIEGHGRLVTHDTVAVDDRRITAPRLVVATGSKPRIPDISGLADAEPLTNENVFDLADAPESLDILGAGASGCEFALAFAAFNMKVTLLESAPRVLPTEDPDASAVVVAALRACGVTVRTGTPVERIEPPDAMKSLLVALGRDPVSDKLGLKQIGVKLDSHGYVVTDDRMATSVKGVYAAGDVTGRLQMTHAADEMGRLAAANALGKGIGGRFREERVPRVIFTDPEVAAVGVLPQKAPPGSRVAYLPLSEMDRAITDGRTDGFIKLIAGPRRLLRNVGGGQIIGASIVAPRAGEMIHEIVLAMRTGAFAGRLAQTAHAYPTWSYGIQKTAAQFFGEIEGRSARRIR